MIGRCTSGPNRREWLRTLGWQVRTIASRLWRRIKMALLFSTICIVSGALGASGVIFALAIIQHLRYWRG